MTNVAALPPNFPPRLASREAAAHDNSALFVSERELHRRVAPHLGRDSFRAAIRALEADGFPKINRLFRGRYLPAVKAWLDDYYGVSTNGPFSEDGPEQFDANPQ